MSDFLRQDEEGLRVTEHLRRAVRSESVPPYLEARIRNTVRTVERPRSWTRLLVPVAAGLAVCLATVIAYELGHLRLTTGSQESYIASVSREVGTLLRIGLGDHLHCAVFRKFRKNPPNAEQLAKRLGPEYSELIPIVRRHIPAEYRLMISHRCEYHGRKFVHLALKSNTKLLSLVIARKQDGESFAIENVAPALTQSGTAYYQGSVQRFAIASFESRDHLVYFISDLERQQNMNLLLAMAPQVTEFLAAKEI